MASRAKAITPAANGAAADVPVCESVHVLLISDVTWRILNKQNNFSLLPIHNIKLTNILYIKQSIGIFVSYSTSHYKFI